MRISISLFTLLHLSLSVVDGFAPASLRSDTSASALRGGVADELGIPCLDECAIVSYPNLPDSVHPGVLSGQAQMDLLNHAKENGKFSL